MRVISLIGAAVALTFPVLAGGLKPGIYPCRTPAGTETGSSFAVGAAGRYGDAPDALTGSMRFRGSEVLFEGAGNDGKFARVISDTRIKIGKRIFCEWEKPLPAAKPPPPAEPEPAADEPDAPRPKLIIVDPAQR